MYFFSPRSHSNLHSCDPRLIRLFENVIDYVDCTVICGRRNKDAQNEAYRLDRSTKEWPNSLHNHYQSLAVDVVPYPIDWIDLNRMAWFAGWVMHTALLLQLPIRWGGDWDSDTHIREHSLIDMPHFEIIKKGGEK